MKRFVNIIIIFLLPLHICAQDTVSAGNNITGIWKGKIITTDKHLPYEIAISETEGKFSGYSYTTYTVNSVEMIAVRTIKIKNDNGNIVTEDDDLLYDNFDKSSPKRIKQTNILILKVEGKNMSLTGSFTTKKTKDFRSAEGEINLHKENDLTQTQMAAKLEEMKLLSAMSFVTPPVKEIVLLERKSIIPEKLNSSIKRSPPTAVVRASIKRIPVAPIQNDIAKVEPKKPVKELAPAPPVKKAVTAPVAKTTVAPKPVVPAKVIPVASIPKPVTAIPKPATTATAPSFSAALAKREIETIQTVFFKTDSLLLTLYDNGTVDGDTVSIILDGKMILAKQGLSTNPVNKTIYIPQGTGDSMQLVMYAENLGSLPPNTGLLIIKDGSERYEIRFAGDLKKNAAIILRRKKEQ